MRIPYKIESSIDHKNKNLSEKINSKSIVNPEPKVSSEIKVQDAENDKANSILEIYTPATIHHGAHKLSDEELITDSNEENDGALTEVDEKSQQEDLEEPSVNNSSLGATLQ